MTMRNLSRRVPICGRGYTLASKACGPLSCHMYALICSETNEGCIIDPSFTNPDEFNSLTNHIQRSNNAKITDVLLTHGHPDHVMGVVETMKTWPDAALRLHPLEEYNYETCRELGYEMGLVVPGTGSLPTPTHELDDGETIQIGKNINFTVIHTPGHSPGHVTFADTKNYNNTNNNNNNNNNKVNENDDIDDGGTRTASCGSVLISGDLIFHGSVGRTDLEGSSIDDLYGSIRRLYELFDDESILLTGHTTPTYMKKERIDNPFVNSALERPMEWYNEMKQHHQWIMT